MAKGNTKENRNLSNILRSLKQERALYIIVFIISYILAVGLPLVIAGRSSSEHAVEILIHPLAFAVSLIVTVGLYLIDFRGKHEERSNMIWNSIEQTEANLLKIVHVASAGKILTMLQSVPEPLEYIGEELFAKASGFVTVTSEDGHSISDRGKSLVVYGEDLSIYAYNLFWNHILSDASKLAKDGLAIPEVFVTHSSSVGIWKAPDEITLDLLSKQRAFSNLGGIVTRILVPSTAGPFEQTAYDSAASLMRTYNVQVQLLPIDKRGYYSLDFDFMVLPEFGYVIKWFSGGGGRTISRCELLIDKIEAAKLKVVWDYVKTASTPYP